MRILSWDCHEGLLTAWSYLGHEIDLLPYVPEWKWNVKKRPIPDNIHFVNDHRQNKYDLVVAFNEHKQLGLAIGICQDLRIPRILSLASLSPIRDYNRIASENVVFCSRTQSEKLGGIRGQVVYYPINTDEFKGYTGHNGRILSTINYFGQKSNRASRGFDWAMSVTAGLDYDNYGFNLQNDDYKCPHPESFDELKRLYQNYSLYLDPVVDSPMSMSCLEAMASGMPMVTRPHDDWPLLLQDGYNAIISNNDDHIKSKMRELLKDPDQRAYIGQNARKMIIDNFSIQAWKDNWAKIFKKVVGL